MNWRQFSLEWPRRFRRIQLVNLILSGIGVLAVIGRMIWWVTVGKAQREGDAEMVRRLQALDVEKVRELQAIKDPDERERRLREELGYSGDLKVTIQNLKDRP